MPSPHLSIVDAIQSHALKQPNREAFIFVNETLDRLVLTRQKLWDYCRKYAVVLRRKELGKGSVVCNTLRNSPQRLITDFGAITAGAIAMNGQICFADGADFIFSLNQGKANAVILDPDDTKGAFAILKPKFESYDQDSGAVSCPEVPSLKFILPYRLRSESKRSGEAFLEDLNKVEDMAYEDITPEEVCQYLCTSGSTNIFKLVAFNSHVLTEFGIAFGGSVGATEDDNYMNNRPLGWLGGYPSFFIALGTCRVIFDESNGRPDNFSECQWRMACQERCAICFTPPASLVEFNAVREASDNDFMKNKFRMRAILSGGGPVTKHCMLAALKKLSEEVVVVYASTEGGTMSYLRVKDIVEYEEFKTGFPAPGVEIKVVDEKGEELPPGQRGEIQIKTPQAALYYVNDPVNTKHAFQSNGWLRLGDIGSFNDKKELSVIGRDKFAIMRGIIIYYPYALEGFVRNCPGVRDVIMTGVPDEKYHEELCALVIRKSDEELSAEDVKKFCEDGIASEQVNAMPIPRYVLFVESFPQTMNGKLDRNEVKKQVCQMLDLQL